MTLSDYSSNPKLEKTGIFKIQLEPDDVHIWKGSFVWEGNKRVQAYSVEVKRFRYSYFTTDGNLYTMDEHGNKRTPSVFKLNFSINL